jgi:hypothetical protein
MCFYRNNTAACKFTLLFKRRAACIDLQRFQEVANPEVRPHLKVYPDDGAKRCCGPWHAKCWRCEVPGELSGPMVRAHSTAMGSQDFYVQEPCLIQQLTNDIIPVIPVRWFTRREKLFGQFHLLVVESGSQYTIGDHMEVSVDRLLLSYPLFLQNHHHYNLPRPTQVKGDYSFCIHSDDYSQFRTDLY